MAGIMVPLTLVLEETIGKKAELLPTIFVLQLCTGIVMLLFSFFLFLF